MEKSRGKRREIIFDFPSREDKNQAKAIQKRTVYCTLALSCTQLKSLRLTAPIESGDQEDTAGYHMGDCTGLKKTGYNKRGIWTGQSPTTQINVPSLP